MTVNLTSTNVDRLRKAVENDMELVLLDEPEVAVTDHTSDSDSTHIVNADTHACTCKDYQHNCANGEYCKHVWYTVLKRVGML